MPKSKPARLARVIHHLRHEPTRTSADARVGRARRVEDAYLQALRRSAVRVTPG